MSLKVILTYHVVHKVKSIGIILKIPKTVLKNKHIVTTPYLWKLDI